MDGLRLPAVIEEIFDQSGECVCSVWWAGAQQTLFPTQKATVITPPCSSADEPCDLKEDKATILESLMAEEKDGGMAADGDKDQEKEVTEEKGRESEELDWEELGAQLFHILLELEEAREVSLRCQEDYQELQGESPHSRLQLGRLLNHFLVLRQQLMTVLISGQLEEERFVSAEQAETFSRQIQSLKGSSRHRQPPEAPRMSSGSVKDVLVSRSAVQRPGAEAEPAGAEEAGAALGSGGGAAAAVVSRGGCRREGGRHRCPAGGAVSARRSAAAPPPDPAGGPPGGHCAEGQDRPQEPEPGPEPW